MSTKIHTLSIRIMGPEVETYDGGPNKTDTVRGTNFDEKNQVVVDEFRSNLSNVEDLVNNVLPDEFYAKVEE